MSTEREPSPSFEAASFRSLNFEKADFSSISDSIRTYDWEASIGTHGLEDFPKVFTNIILGICHEHCPRKLPPKHQSSSKMRALSRKKRKLQERLEAAKADPLSSDELIRRLEESIALLHFDIRDRIVSGRCHLSLVLSRPTTKTPLSTLCTKKGVMQLHQTAALCH